MERWKGGKVERWKDRKVESILHKQFSAPIVEAMQNYSADGALAFHTPGHKQGLGAHKFLKNLITTEGLRQEVSLMEELDDLHAPHSCIKDAESLAAELFHADEVLFCVNGATSAVQAMILGTLKPRDLVFVPRNSHRSVMAGIILSGALPIFLPIDFDENLKIPLNLKVETLQAAIKKFPQAKALILTSPNYYGVAADLKKIAELLHSAGMILLVDEAHGAHLQFSKKILSAMDSGADLSAQSTHKVLGSLTQTSMLLLKNKFIDAKKIRRAASLLQTTSPNQLLLASLDIARLQMAEVGEEKIFQAEKLSKLLRAEINSINGLKTFDAVKNFQLDLLKVTVNVEELGLTGIEAEKILRNDLKIQCELSDATNLLFLITYADNAETISKLITSLKKVERWKGGEVESKKNSSFLTPNFSLATLSPREVFFAETENVALEKSVGKICAEEITFYPPGIPVLNPGEVITAEILNYICEIKKLGGRIIGATDAELSTVQVCK